MSFNDALRFIEDVVCDELLGKKDETLITFNNITYILRLNYAQDGRYLILQAQLSIPDYEMAMRMKMADYRLFDKLNDRLKTIDFENYY